LPGKRSLRGAGSVRCRRYCCQATQASAFFPAREDRRTASGAELCQREPTDQSKELFSVIFVFRIGRAALPGLLLNQNRLGGRI